MKNIKFRAWSEDTHEMIQVARLDIKEETIHYENGIKSLNREHELGFWWKPYVLMQYTGLKDKNGVEIYEGDLIQVEGMFPNEPFKVWYRNGMYHIGNWNLQGFMNAFDFYEVIGNIYENSDLLEVKH